MDNKIKKRQRKSDYLELFIVLSLIFMIITIYVPKAIWVEESNIEEESRFNIQNVYDAEMFYNTLTDSFNSEGEWAMDLINAIRDSLHADSTYLGEKTLTLDGKTISVNIPKGFDVEFDTTFGYARTRRDTIIDTTHTIVLFSEELGRNDTIFIPHNKLKEFEGNANFVAQVGTEIKLRTELINYYDSYQPSQFMLNCPLTKDLYQITISEDNNSVRVASPITDVYKERRYLIFSFKAQNHGYISDGIRSWD
ncbi:MAG: hypothetical protein ACE5D0_06240 [Fidelibacterota bacterium]